MMSPTHVVVGPILAIPVLLSSPEYAVTAAVAAIAGGVFPDFDLVIGEHRRTLHFPVGYWALALPTIGWALLDPRTASIAAALFFSATGVHSLQDWFGAAPEARPWESTSNRAVYLHVTGEWLSPKRWVRYDGAPEDLALTLALGVPGIMLYESPVPAMLTVALIVGVVYVLVRKRLPRYVAGFVD